MKFSTTVVCAICLVLTACVPTNQRTALKSEAIHTENPASSSTIIGVGPVSPEGDGLAKDLLALKLVTLGEEGEGLKARLVNPLTLADLPGYPSIDFGHHYTYALSPDGMSLALIAWPSGTHNREGTLQLIDLPDWVDHAAGVRINQHVSALVFSADGEKLYWSEPTATDPAHGMPRDYKLFVYVLGKGVRREVIQLPGSFQPWEMRLLNTGSRLAIYGIPTTPDNLAEDVPQVLLVDLDTGSLAADVRLEGVMAGQVEVDPAGANEYPYWMYTPGLAWDLERSLLYVVHADSDRATVVDLEAGEVQRGTEILPEQSLLERLLGWLAIPAQAKAVPGTEKWAALDPEGDHLYIAGLGSEMERKGEGQEWVRRQVPLGLQVIATDGLTELGRLDLPVINLALLPDGRWLLVTGAYDVAGADGQLERKASGLYLVDAHNLQVAHHLLPEREVYLNGFSADGRYGYVSTASSEWLGDRWGNWSVKLHVLELESGQFVAEREFGGYFLDVIQ